MAKISIEAKQGVYLSYKNYPYTADQVLGEFIDNAIQSAEDNKNQLYSMDSNYKLRVEINVEWYYDEQQKTELAKSICIEDNAAGMNSDVFSHAFNLADSDVTRKGMNEFGIGMKAASAWFGNSWKVESTSIDDNITRRLLVDLTDVAKNQIKLLDSEEFPNPTLKHGTRIEISELWPENLIKKSSIDQLVKNVASIYRYFIRNKKIEIFFGEDLLTFDEYPVLKLPSFNNPSGESIVWKKNVSFDDHQGHKVSGFIALLRDMAGDKRGVVFTRNNRVVLGFDPDKRIVGKAFYGQVGSKRYRRVFGELELTGFSVSFGKNQLNDVELLESFCQILAGKLKIDGYSMLTQADKITKNFIKDVLSGVYNSDNDDQYTQSGQSTHLSEPEMSGLSDPKTPSTSTPEEPLSTDTNPEVESPSTTVPETSSIPGAIVSSTPDSVVPNTSSAVTQLDILNEETSFHYLNDTFTFKFAESVELSDLFWNDLSLENENILICRINLKHRLFQLDTQTSNSTFALIKAISIAKFIAMREDNDLQGMMLTLNSILNN